MMTAKFQDVQYQAFLAKDARFDGQFFVGVRTTGIYCRPICPAKTPKPENCEFFPNAALAHQAGYRPCLRCRPELSPHLWACVGTGSTVARALRLIETGALDQGSVTDLAQRLGMTDRHLRQLFVQHVGISPQQIAHTRRLHFAKQLLHDTQLSMTEVAIASGFNSIRRFNDTFQKAYGIPPSKIRREHPFKTQNSKLKTQASPSISLKLAYCPPLHWSALLAYWQPRLMAGIESIDGLQYSRTFQIQGQPGRFTLQPAAQGHYLQVHLYNAPVSQLSYLVTRLRRLFDLDADPMTITTHLQTDATLHTLITRYPGLRLPGAWDPFELAVRAILGQQITVAAATTRCNRLIATYGTLLSSCASPPLTSLFPTPHALAEADLTSLGIPRTRAQTLNTLARRLVEQPEFFNQFTTLDEAIETLCQIPGIGPWTAHYMALRALQEPDAFPSCDRALLRTIETLEQPMTPAQFEQRAERWRPWRAYAAVYLWAMSNEEPLKFSYQPKYQP
jgi:AraC family transcriptional regulator of adaptative response / DNA-3-methyladenine glycosylase II